MDHYHYMDRLPMVECEPGCGHNESSVTFALVYRYAWFMCVSECVN